MLIYKNTKTSANYGGEGTKYTVEPEARYALNDIVLDRRGKHLTSEAYASTITALEFLLRCPSQTSFLFMIHPIHEYSHWKITPLLYRVLHELPNFWTTHQIHWRIIPIQEIPQLEDNISCFALLFGHH